MLTAISVVLDGEIYVPTFALGRLDEREGIETLTDRQAEILALLSQGLSNKTIATRLDLSEKTVKAHLTAVYRAIGVATREEAVKALSRRQPS